MSCPEPKSNQVMVFNPEDEQMWEQLWKGAPQAADPVVEETCRQIVDEVETIDVQDYVRGHAGESQGE